MIDLLERVEDARAAYKEHCDLPLPSHDELAAWWQTRKRLIEDVLTAERAAIDAGLLSDFTADF